MFDSSSDDEDRNASHEDALHDAEPSTSKPRCKVVPIDRLGVAKDPAALSAACGVGKKSSARKSNGKARRGGISLRKRDLRSAFGELAKQNLVLSHRDIIDGVTFFCRPLSQNKKCSSGLEGTKNTDDTWSFRSVNLKHDQAATWISQSAFDYAVEGQAEDIELLRSTKGVWVCSFAGCGWRVQPVPVAEGEPRHKVDSKFSVLKHDDAAHEYVEEDELDDGVETQEESGVGNSQQVLGNRFSSSSASAAPASSSNAAVHPPLADRNRPPLSSLVPGKKHQRELEVSNGEDAGGREEEDASRSEKEQTIDSVRSSPSVPTGKKQRIEAMLTTKHPLVLDLTSDNGDEEMRGNGKGGSRGWRMQG
ncbi:hypothetical protein JCM8547_005523 [Rhodosporidiobolus lusitaniae]